MKSNKNSGSFKNSFVASVDSLSKESTALDVLTALNRENQLAPFVEKNNGGGVAVVTGANSGIGEETVKILALAGMDVISCARNVRSAEEAVERLPSYLQERVIDIQRLDLADFESIVTAANNIRSKCKHDENNNKRRISVLVNNAGIMAIPSRQFTKQGIELQLGTNHVGHFLLTRLLLPSMMLQDNPTNEDAAARIVTVSSTAHSIPTLTLNNNKNIDSIVGTKAWESLSSTNDNINAYSPWGAYGFSKLANILFTKELTRLVAEAGRQDEIIPVTLHPGVISSSNLGRYILPSFLQPTFKKATAGQGVGRGPVVGDNKSIQQGAATTIYCALSNDITPGAYYDSCQQISPSKAAENVQNAKLLWAYTEKLIADKGIDLPPLLMQKEEEQKDKLEDEENALADENNETAPQDPWQDVKADGEDDE